VTGGRTVVHLVYAGLQARLELIARCLPRLQSESPPRRFFFVDVPLGATSGLEVVQLHPRSDSAVRSDLSAWLDSCRAHNLITTASFGGAPMVLNPAFFPNGRVPPFYLTAMADGSARVATLLAELGGPASEQVVVDEIAALYASLVPRQAERRGALELYATWLERTAAGTVGDGSPHSSPTGPIGHIARASLIARLAHTQAVRLRGPDYPGGLDREAALVRSLLGEDPATSSPTTMGT